MNHVISNMAHSVRERLNNLAKSGGRNTDYLFQRYAFERFYWRIGKSDYAERFIIKGASLFTLWMGPMYRVTQDTDLESRLAPDHERIAAAFREIASVPTPSDDGVRYDMGSMTVDDIWTLSRNFSFDFRLLKTAVSRTFGRKGIGIPEDWPVGLTDAFAEDRDKNLQWRAFLRKTEPASKPDSLADAVTRIREFLRPIIFQLGNSSVTWIAGVGWAESSCMKKPAATISTAEASLTPRPTPPSA